MAWTCKNCSRANWDSDKKCFNCDEYVNWNEYKICKNCDDETTFYETRSSDNQVFNVCRNCEKAFKIKQKEPEIISECQWVRARDYA